MNRYLTLLLIVVSSFANAQTKFGIDFTPGLSGAFVNVTAPYGKYSQQAFSDSIQPQQMSIFTPGFGLHMITKPGKFNQIYWGLQYQTYGWGRKKANVHFLDSIHSDIGKVLDLSQTVERDIEFYFKFHQIVVPVYLMQDIRWRKMPVGMTLGTYYGGALHATILQNSTAKTIGFSAYGKKEFNLPSETFKFSPINLSLQAGLRMTQIIGEDLYFNFMPGASLLLLPSKNNVERQIQHRLQIGLGISKVFK